MPFMNNSSFEQELKKHGKLIYPNVGTSMMPLLRERRDLMVISRRPEGRLRKHDAVLYKRGGKYILHRIVKVRKDSYDIRGDHQWRHERGVKDAQIIGVLSAVVRDGQEIPVTDRKYSRYASLRYGLYPFHVSILFFRDLLGRTKRKLASYVKEE